MTLFGPTMGNLPLLELPESKLLKLSAQDHYDLRQQLRHHCVRSAWMKYIHSSYDIRDLLDLSVGRAYVTLVRARGAVPSATLLNIDMEEARRENEWWSCFGFFLEDEVLHLFRKGCPGPVLTSIISPEHHALGAFAYAELLQDMLVRYRQKLRDDPMALDTALFVQTTTKRESCIKSLPDNVQKYFKMAEVLLNLAREGKEANGPEIPASH